MIIISFHRILSPTISILIVVGNQAIFIKLLHINIEEGKRNENY